MSDIVSQKLSFSQGAEFIRALERAGLTPVLAQRVIQSRNNLLADRLVRAIRYRETVRTTVDMARAIMGTNFFGLEDAVKHFAVRPTKEEIAVLDIVPFSERVLEACKDSHMLAAVFPLSINDMRRVVKSGLCVPDRHMANQGLMRKHGAGGWRLVRKTPALGSVGKPLIHQIYGLASDHERMASVRTIVYATLGQYLARGELLFHDVFVRCRYADSGGNYPIVGCVKDGHWFVSVGFSSNQDRRDDVGLAVARIPTA